MTCLTYTETEGLERFIDRMIEDGTLLDWNEAEEKMSVITSLFMGEMAEKEYQAYSDSQLE